MLYSRVSNYFTMSFDSLQKSRLVLKIMGIFGLLTNDKICSRFPKFQPIYYKLMLHVPLTFTLTMLMWLDVVSSADINEAADVLYIALTETALVAKIASIWHYDALVKSLFNEWQKNEMFKLQTAQECVIWQRKIKVFGLLTSLYTTCSLSVVGCAFIAVLFLNRYQLPFRYWMPFNWKHPSNYWYAYGYELLAFPLTCISNCASDLLFCYMMQHLALQFKMIALRLQKLGNKKHDTNANIRKKLLAIIKLHLKLKSMSKSCEAIVSYAVLVQILLSAFVLCFSLYRLRNFNILEDPINFLSLLQYSAVMIMQIFMFCFYGNKLTTESSCLLKSIYNSNWPNMSTYNRKLILQYMQYLQEPVVIKAGNFFYLNLTTYRKTMNNAYSFFSLLLNMDI